MARQQVEVIGAWRGSAMVSIGIQRVCAALVVLAGCATPPAARSSAGPCEEGVLKPCTCEDGSKSTQICAGGIYKDCSCAGDAAGRTDGTPTGDGGGTSDGGGGVSGDASTSDVATTDTAQADSSGASTCQSDKDCKTAGKVCDPLTKQCVACLTDAECGPSQHCVGLVCQGYTSCTNSLGCKAAKGPDGKDQPICDQGIGECSACLTAADCPASHDCKAKQCVPYKTCQNSTECGKDEVCDKASSRCVQCLGDNDCAANQLCEQGKCNSFIPCSSDKQCTDKGLLCDQAKGKCAQCLANSDCPGIYNCQNVGVAKTGVCVLDVCAQGQGACSNNAKVTCNSVGDGYGSPQSCPSQTTCVAPGSKPECKAWACTPGSSCQGDKAVECGSDGLEVVKTTDCAASAQKCLSGQCKSLVCEPAGQYCDGNTVKQCAADGLSGSVQKTCGTNEFCDGGACKPQVCAPGQKACDGNTATTCNASGSGYVAGGQPCGSQKCLGGECKAQLCVAGTSYCEGGKLKLCSPDGTSVLQETACASGTFCGTGPGGDAACVANVCDPGKPACNGSVFTTCKVDGSGYVAGGQDCKLLSKVCTASDGCKSQVCDQAVPLYCDGKTVKQCAADGMSGSTVKTCGPSEFCDKGGCKPQVCTPNQLSCNGSVKATCNANGSGYLSGGEDCKASGKSCSAGQCVAQTCGNGVVEGTEQCDDGNTADGDACSASCGKAAITKLTCGDYNVCCVLNSLGALSCWGNGAPTISGAGWKDVSVNHGVTVAIDSANNAKLFAAKSDGCGVTAMPAQQLQSVSVGVWGACGIKLDNAMSCWGGTCGAGCNASGQYVAQAGQYVAVSSASNSSCAIQKDGQMKCWGCNSSGQLNVPAATEGWSMVDVRHERVAAVTKTGALKLWGLSSASGPAPSGAFIDAVCQPGNSCCAVTTQGALSCWGTEAAIVNGVPGGTFKAVEITREQEGVSTGCAVTSGDAVTCWGNDAALKTIPASLKSVCTPNAPSCLGNLAGTCNGQGTGLTSATDCKASGKACSAGQCISSFASCKAALTANPAATDGIYLIDPDGPTGPIIGANLFCDMKNGGLTLVGNYFDSAGDDMPNTTDFVVSGWQQTGSGKWDAKAATVDRAWGGGTGSAAVSLAFVAALKASAGQQNLKMCFVHKDGYDTSCRNSANGSMTLVSYNIGNPKLTVHAADKLTYTFGRLAGLAGSVDGYDMSQFKSYFGCVPVTPGVKWDGEFGGAGDGLCDFNLNDCCNINYNHGVWMAYNSGISFKPMLSGEDELSTEAMGSETLVSNPSVTSYGFRLYVGP